MIWALLTGTAGLILARASFYAQEQRWSLKAIMGMMVVGMCMLLWSIAFLVGQMFR